MELSRHTDAARARLAHLGGLAHRTTEGERKILEAAEHRLEAVNADLERLRPRALLDDAVGDQYQDLVTEKGTLLTVIAQAQEALAA